MAARPSTSASCSVTLRRPGGVRSPPQGGRARPSTPTHAGPTQYLASPHDRHLSPPGRAGRGRAGPGQHRPRPAQRPGPHAHRRADSPTTRTRWPPGGPIPPWTWPGRSSTGPLPTPSTRPTASSTCSPSSPSSPARWACEASAPSVEGWAERWGWRIVLVGYALTAVSLFFTYWVANLDIVFLAVTIPSLLLSSVGQRAARRRTDQGRLPPPADRVGAAPSSCPLSIGLVAISTQALGMWPMMLAWGVAGWSLWKAPTQTCSGAHSFLASSSPSPTGSRSGTSDS